MKKNLTTFLFVVGVSCFSTMAVDNYVPVQPIPDIEHADYHYHSDLTGNYYLYNKVSKERNIYAFEVMAPKSVCKQCRIEEKKCKEDAARKVIIAGLISFLLMFVGCHCIDNDIKIFKFMWRVLARNKRGY